MTETVAPIIKPDISEFTFIIDETEDYRSANIRLASWLDHGILLLKYEQLPDQSVLNQYAEDTAEAFFQRYGQWPTDYNMGRLSNVCLLYFIKSKRPDKNKQKNSFHTERRLQKNRGREWSGYQATTLDHLQNKRINPDSYAKVSTQEPKEG